jgi:transposase InsO family protein
MTLRFDNGGEYVNHDLHNFLSQYGIVHHTTCAYTPQQNGVAERKNQHLLEVVHAFLFEAQICNMSYETELTMYKTNHNKL